MSDPNISDKKRFTEGRRRFGFTLIELLVVVSIIGLFSSVVMASLNSVRREARNTFRNKVVDEYTKALYLYYDTNGEFPDPMDGSGGSPITGYSCLAEISSTCSWAGYSIPANIVLNNKLSQYIKVGEPLLSVNSGGSSYQGPLYSCRTSPPVCTGERILWMLEEIQTCSHNAQSIPWIDRTLCDLTLE